MKNFIWIVLFGLMVGCSEAPPQAPVEENTDCKVVLNEQGNFVGYKCK